MFWLICDFANQASDGVAFCCRQHAILFGYDINNSIHLFCHAASDNRAIRLQHDALWRQRGMDVLVQVAIIFAGAIGVLGLLAAPEPAAPPEIEPIEQSIVSEPAPDEPVGVGEERAEVLV